MAESRRGERKKGAEQGKMYSVIKTKKNSDSRDARCTSGLLIAPFGSLFSSPFFFFVLIPLAVLLFLTVISVTLELKNLQCQPII